MPGSVLVPGFFFVSKVRLSFSLEYKKMYFAINEKFVWVFDRNWKKCISPLIRARGQYAGFCLDDRVILSSFSPIIIINFRKLKPYYLCIRHPTCQKWLCNAVFDVFSCLFDLRWFVCLLFLTCSHERSGALLPWHVYTAFLTPICFLPSVWLVTRFISVTSSHKSILRNQNHP